MQQIMCRVRALIMEIYNDIKNGGIMAENERIFKEMLGRLFKFRKEFSNPRNIYQIILQWIIKVEYKINKCKVIIKINNAKGNFYIVFLFKKCYFVPKIVIYTGTDLLLHEI